MENFSFYFKNNNNKYKNYILDLSCKFKIY